MVVPMYKQDKEQEEIKSWSTRFGLAVLVDDEWEKPDVNKEAEVRDTVRSTSWDVVTGNSDGEHTVS